MAMVIGITYVDDYGRTTTRRVTTESATLALAIDDAEALVAAMLAVSDLGTIKYEISNVVQNVEVPGTGSNIDVGATLTTLLASAKKYGFRVPGVKAALLNADGSVKFDDPLFDDLFALFIPGAKLRVSDGEAIVDVLHGELDK